MPTPERLLVGWDVGGAHLKACLLRDGRVMDVAQWACPLWQGLDHLDGALEQARLRWPQLACAAHAVTMTGEMADLFADREQGVHRIAQQLSQTLRPRAGALQFYAGDAGWCGLAELARHWQHIASANWLATAQHAAARFGQGVLVDIGSTTTDLIAFSGGRVATTSRTDAHRLATGELVYHGVVRTPLCALARRIEWRHEQLNVMNEFFATVADVYRLTGELDPVHDLHSSADGMAKDAPATRRRLARMIGLDERDGTPQDWLAFARAWRGRQVAELGGQLQRVMARHEMSGDSVIVSAGCGDFLVADVLAHALAAEAEAGRAPTRWVRRAYGTELARIADDAIGGRDTVAAWAQVCAPAVAVATLLDGAQR
jgi:probable H4MPT-linked C1 transfer pathway protein